MSILEFVEARKEHDRTRMKTASFPYRLAMEPGRELLQERYDEVVRIALWFIRHRRSRNAIEGVGGEEELLQQTLLTILRSRPKTPVSLTTRVCHYTSLSLRDLGSWQNVVRDQPEVRGEAPTG